MVDSPAETTPASEEAAADPAGDPAEPAALEEAATVSVGVTVA